VVRAGEIVEEAPIEAVSMGDEVEVLAGDSIPVDGVVLAGDSCIDQSLLTGESLPIAVAEGDLVSAGAVNLGAPLRIRVHATGEATRVGRLLRMVEEGTTRRAPIVRLADRAAGWFIAGMLLLSGATLVFWLWRDPGAAIGNAAALLIVTCPCALGLATPLAVTVAVGRAARRGILIKGGDAIQSLAGTGTIFLDKTGTITEGRMSLVRWEGPDWAKPLAGAIEACSTHPIAAAIATACDSTLEAVQVKSHARGIEGIVDGRRVLVGAGDFVREQATDLDDAFACAEERLAAEGLTPVLVAANGRIVAAAGVGDPVRDDAAVSIGQLRRSGWSIGILSGDHPDVVAAVARTVEVDPEMARGGMTPEEKLAAITQAAARGPVVMVGDGINDAAALAAATVGIAVHGGAEASLAAADIYLARPGLSPIAELIVGSRRTIATIRRNFVIAVFYNAIAASLAVTGLINPLLAAILMPVASLSVLTMSFQSRSFEAGGASCR
jgi:Cu2+-exporting ATPase